MSATTRILGPYQPRSTGIGNVAPIRRVSSGGTDHVSAAPGAGAAAHQQVQQARSPHGAPYAPARKPVMQTGAMGNGSVYQGPQGQRVELIPRPGATAAAPMGGFAGADAPAVEILQGPAAFRASAQRQTSFTIDEVLLIGELLIASGEAARQAGADDSVARSAYEKLAEIAPAPDQQVPPAPRPAPAAAPQTLRSRVQEQQQRGRAASYSETLATPPGARVVDLDADLGVTTEAPQG